MNGSILGYLLFFFGKCGLSFLINLQGSVFNGENYIILLIASAIDYFINNNNIIVITVDKAYYGAPGVL